MFLPGFVEVFNIPLQKSFSQSKSGGANSKSSLSSGRNTPGSINNSAATNSSISLILPLLNSSFRQKQPHKTSKSIDLLPKKRCLTFSRARLSPYMHAAIKNTATDKNMNNFIFATYSCMSNKLSNQYPNTLPIYWAIAQFSHLFSSVTPFSLHGAKRSPTHRHLIFFPNG